jgi:UDP-glucose:(heptosyl)LPS alpha-1,3-glucosyltransferase
MQHTELIGTVSMSTPDPMVASEISILQIARDIAPGGGISGVAWALEGEFLRKAQKVDRFMLKNVGGRQRESRMGPLLLTKIGLMMEVMHFSVTGTLALRRRARPWNEVIICHGDVLVGDIYVNHGLHRAMVLSSPSPLKTILRNPFHLFLLLREWIRLRFDIHSKIVCFGQIEADAVIKHYPHAKKKICLIPNGVDITKFSPSEATRISARLSLNISADEFVMIFVGHEFRRKGLNIAIESMHQLPPTVCLLVVGGNSTTEIENAKKVAVEAGVGDRVKFLGRRTDVSELMCAADVFVLPTYYETWALVGLEAMACGTPVLMTAVGGIREYLSNGVNGQFIERTPGDLAEKVKAMMADPDELLKMKLNARNTALAFSWEVVAAEYLKLVKEVAKSRQTRA